MSSSEAVTLDPWSAEVDRHRPWLERLITSRLGSTEGVADVLQEIGLAVAKSEDRPKQSEELAPWLCRIAIRQCAQHLRGQIRRQRLIQDYAHQQPNRATQDADPIFGLMQDERQSLLREAIGGLPNELRDVLFAKYFERLTYQAISARFGITEHAVEYRLIEARKRLRQSLAGLE